MKTTSVENFYNDIATQLSAKISKETGYFHVFRYEDVTANYSSIL